jgi:hypothetical protein
MNRDLLEHSINICKQCILSKKQEVSIRSKNYLVWPLFFLEGTQPREDGVDICATALGISSSVHFISQNVNDENEIYTSVKDGISTLLFVRNVDGSWPSKISLVTKDNVSMEGVISDTYYALTALMDIKFITNNPKVTNLIDPQNNHDLNSLNDRLEIVEKGVQWLLDNRVGQGWGYTGVKYLEDRTGRNIIPAYVVPSMNAITIMSRILSAEKEINPQSCYIEKIEAAIRETVNWICEIQNQDGGFGIKRGEKSRVGNTAKVLVALCTISVPNDIEERIRVVINKSVKFILKKYNPKKVRFENVSEDFSQFIVETNTNDGSVNAFKRPIIHELYLEPLILEALSLYYFKIMGVDSNKKKLFFKNKIYITLKQACEEMLANQKADGDIQGAAKCRRPAQCECYTMYACHDLIESLMLLTSDNVLFKRVTKSRITYFIKIVIFIVLIILAFVPVKFGEYPILISVILLVISPIALNIVGNLVEKIIIVDD